MCAYVRVCVCVVAVLPAQGGTGPRHLESFSENFECGRRGMCAQIKEKEKVKEKYSKARGWRVREIDTDIDGERLGKGKVWQVRKRWWEDKGGKGGGRVCAT